MPNYSSSNLNSKPHGNNKKAMLLLKLWKHSPVKKLIASHSKEQKHEYNILKIEKSEV